MAKQTINIGASPNDGTGTPLRTSFDYCNQNFTELYTATGPSGNNIAVPGTATITGALTVGTATALATGSGRGNVTVNGSTDAILAFGIGGVNSGFILEDAGGMTLLSTGATYIRAYTNGVERYRIASDGVATWSNVGGVSGTAMTLNSTGLGVGASPTNGKLIVGADATTDGNGSWNTTFRNTVGAATTAPKTGLAFSGYWNGTSNFANFAGISGGKENTTDANTAGMLTLWTSPNGGSPTTRLTIDSSGNVGVGVAPSAWNNSYNVLDIGQNGSISGRTSTNNTVDIVSNGFRNSGGTWVYKLAASSPASRYQIDGSTGAHIWYTGAAGTAGNTIAGFSTALMALDASGNLLVGTTGNGTSARMIISQASGSLPALYLSGGAGTTPLINFNGSGRVRSDGNYLTIETTNASGVIYMTANTNGVYLAVNGTSWTANSDERLKDIIEPISNAVSKVGSLRSVIGKFKTDSEGTRRTFLIAQDVQKVLPEAVDASNPDRLGVGYSEVIPLLVAAIKELTARVQTLEAR